MLNSPFNNPFWAGFSREYPDYAGFSSWVQSQQGSTQWNYQLFDTLYRTSWVAEKCVTAIADDVCDKWRVFEHDDPEVLKKRQAFEEENEISSIIREALITSRLYGGAAIIPILKSQFDEDHFKQEFNPRSVKKNDLSGFQVLSKYDFAPVQGINRDIFQSPKVFGDYIYYKIIRIQTMSGESTTLEPVAQTQLPMIHVTRMIKFFGKELLYYQKFFSGGWGDSILVPIINKIPAVEEAFHLLFMYLDLFNIDEVKIPNLAAVINTSGAAHLFETYTAFRDKMRSSKLRFMDSADEMNRNQLSSIQNVVPVFQSLMQFCVGATGIPITRILGTSVQGWSTGDNELVQYYDLVFQNQKKLAGQLRVIDEIIERSIFGKKMDIKYRWLPKREMTEKERAEVNQIKSTAFASYIQQRVMTPQKVAENIKEDYNGIDDNYILGLDEDFLDYENNTETFGQEEGIQGDQEKGAQDIDGSKVSDIENSV
jgi:phage-related protein (TIGR01555 family)